MRYLFLPKLSFVFSSQSVWGSVRDHSSLQRPVEIGKEKDGRDRSVYTFCSSFWILHWYCKGYVIEPKPCGSWRFEGMYFGDDKQVWNCILRLEDKRSFGTRVVFTGSGHPVFVRRGLPFHFFLPQSTKSIIDVESRYFVCTCNTQELPLVFESQWEIIHQVW